jgi:hypothetical protein
MANFDPYQKQSLRNKGHTQQCKSRKKIVPSFMTTKLLGYAIIYIRDASRRTKSMDKVF